MNPPWHSEVQHTLGLRCRQNGTLNVKLPDRFLQVAHGRRTEEALDLDRDLLPGLFRGECDSLGARIDEEILATVGKGQRVMGNGPAVREEGTDNHVMMNVPGRHGYSRVENQAVAPPCYLAGSDSTTAPVPYPAKAVQETTRLRTCQPFPSAISAAM